MSRQAPKAVGQGQYLDASKLARPEIIGMASGVLLFISLWLPWFSTSDDNPNSVIDSAGIGPGESANAWQTFGSLDWLLLLLSAAPFILAWIISRQHELGWRPGEVTMIVGMTGLLLVLCNGIILGKPEPAIDISLSWGWFLALIACIGIIVAGYQRQALYVRGPRKPPGVM